MDSAIIYADKAIEICQTACSDSLKSRACVARANLARISGDYAVQRQYLIKAGGLVEIEDTLGLAGIYGQWGLFHWQTGKYDSAIYYNDAVRRMMEVTGDSLRLSVLCNNNGILYMEMDRLDKAIETYEAGLRFAKNISDSLLIAWLHNNLSIAYRKQGDFEKSRVQALKAIDISLRTGSRSHLQSHYTNLGATYLHMDSLERSEQALSLAEGHIVDSSTSTKVSYHRAELLIAQKQYSQALALGEEIVKIATKYDLTDDIMFGNEIQYLAAKASGDYELALTRHERYKAAYDSIYNLEQDKLIAQVEVRYETELKDLKIKESDLRVAVLEGQNRTYSFLLWLLGGMAILTSLIVWLFMERRDARRKKAAQEEYIKNMMLATEAERKRIASELHDHIGQKLSMLKLSIAKDLQGTANTMVDDVVDDVRRVSRELYPWQLEKLSVKAAIEDLIRQIEVSSDIFCSYEIDDVELPKFQALQLYRIVQECLTNVMRHSEASAAKVSLANDEQKCVLTIEDNGKGFDFNRAVQSSTSLGLYTMRERLAQLNGTFSIDSQSTTGTRMSFSIPI